VSITAEQSVDVAAVRERNRQLANEVRVAHSSAKRWIFGAPDIEASRQRAAEVLLEVPEHTASMRVFDVLCAARRTGPVWARRVLAATASTSASRSVTSRCARRPSSPPACATATSRSAHEHPADVLAAPPRCRAPTGC
jgi:hypothetical protein